MSKVHILPPEIVTKIAAGEVIERPASVVKELIENAIDAQAKSIEIALKQAGKTSIHIKDTGTGIEPDDIEKIFQRHSTSKIQNIANLYAIKSLGFRGEALYSIAAISDVILHSKTKSSQTGWEIHLRGGEKKNLSPVSMPEGTQIEVKELFFNTPARKKFLKTDTAELQQILNIFMPYTLLDPTQRFIFNHNGKSIVNLSPEVNQINRIAKALNLKPENILERKEDFPDKNITVQLLLGDINIQRVRKNMQFIFVNNRPVQNHFLSFHLNQVYRLIFPADAHPFFCLYITIPPEDLDVNIHPTKREIKIKNESMLAPLLRTLCEDTLMSHGKAKEMQESLFSYNKKSFKTRTTDAVMRETSQGKYNGASEEQFIFSKENPALPREQDDLKHKVTQAHYIGSFLNKYLLFESSSSLLVIDQHAAQERVTYEKLIRQIESKHIEIQRLLTPFVVQLSPQEKLAWENSKVMLEKIGLETTLWDNDNIALHTHPQLIKNPEIALRNIISTEDVKRFDMALVARHACRNSLMAGDKLAPPAAQFLRDQLVKCHDPFTCPHGRPTVIEIKDGVFEKQFLRK
ncbi:MAG: DNA mismatch repair endonuclease MutL [Candidatus Omnitrophica bacterium]|nr:DNA mismatch repair endonuclease MutL [Candidatus Omnitrophota bacterium]